MPLVLATVGGCRGSASGCGGGPGHGVRRLTTPAPDASACLPPGVALRFEALEPLRQGLVHVRRLPG
jgi:hypothetical protein